MKKITLFLCLLIAIGAWSCKKEVEPDYSVIFDKSEFTGYKLISNYGTNGAYEMGYYGKIIITKGDAGKVNVFFSDATQKTASIRKIDTDNYMVELISPLKTPSAIEYISVNTNTNEAKYYQLLMSSTTVSNSYNSVVFLYKKTK